MSFQENGLYISIFPPDGEEIKPDRNSTTRVTTRVNITNQKHETGVRLEVSLDLNPELQQWCKKHSYKISLGYQQYQEIEFLWDIPPDATSDTYDYDLKIEFLRSDYFRYFQPKRRQLTILPTFKPQPIPFSFDITPASNSTQPITLSPGIPLNLEIDVHNRSNRVDNFRISSDLEDAWYRIRYPEAIEREGAIDGMDALNLLPGEKAGETGKIIYLSIHPPADTVAGNYKPEIQLHSLNSPDLFSKKIVYLNIPPQYLLQAELQTILNKVSYKKGQYKIILTNQGNTFRIINPKVQSSDEDECCEYFLEPSSVRIPPNKTVEVKLEVKPDSKQKRPLLTTKQFNFQVDLIDRNNYTLPQNLPLKTSLFWRSRPLWQLVLLFVLALGFIGGCAWGIWWLFFKPKPEATITLKPERTEYPYGKSIAVDWTVENPETIDKMIIFDSELGANHINTQCYSFSDKPSNGNCIQINQDNLPNNCRINNNIISCSNVIFRHTKDIKQYTFKLRAITNKGGTIERETEPIAILEKPILKVFEPLKTSSRKYKPTDRIKFTFEVSNIKHFTGEDKMLLLINNERQKMPIISQQNIGEFCSRSVSDRYLCTLNIPKLADGEYTLGIELQYDDDGRIDKETKRFAIQEPITVQTPIKLNYFKINGRSTSPIVVEPDKPITISWLVTGKDVNVTIDCIGETLGNSGTKYLTVPEGESQSCTITASDTHSNNIQPRTLRVKVKERPKLEESETQKTIIKNPFGL
ncbi:MAG: hypothetical protein QNJ34_03665 [Xenococcaceae cyanobacterium MO_188.B29]|nr:hypothetical protein [Xenococcaceae cyanobacterium MO_188.B29]